MPFLKNESLTTPGLETSKDLPQRPQPVTTGQIIEDAFSIENSIGAAVMNDVPRLTAPKDPNFDPFASIPKGYEGFADRYIKANTETEVDQISTQLGAELGARQRLADSGATGVVASMAAGIFDPISFIPIGGVAYKTYRIGGSILKGAVATSSAAAASLTLQESAIHYNQITRTLGESAVNVTAGMFLAGVLGAGASAITKQIAETRPLAELLRQIEDDLTPTGAAGAQAAGLQGADLGIKQNKAVKAVTKVVGFQDPSLRLAIHESDIAKDAGVRLAETPLTLQRNDLGIETPISVERRVKVKWEAPMYNALRVQDDSYVQYVKGRSKRFGDVIQIKAERLAGQHSDKLSHLEFRRAVGHAMRNDDVHAIPEVQKVAKNYRASVFDPMLKDAIELKLLPEDVNVTTAASYLNRVYNREALIAKSDQFIEITADWLGRKQRASAQRVSEFDTDIAVLRGEEKPDAAKITAREELHVRDAQDLDRSAAELRSVAHDILRRILGSPGGRLPYGLRIEATGKLKNGKAAPTQSRVFDIEDELIEEFLESDIEAATRRYVRTMGPDIELTREFGDVELTQVRDDLKNELANKLEGATDQKARQKLDKQFRQADEDLSAIAERIRGVYKLPDDPTAWGPRAGRVVREINYMAKLGGMTISALPDIARPVMVHGFSRVFGDLVFPLVTNLAGVRSLSKQIREDMGGATDMLLNTRARVVAGLDDDDFLRFSKFERGVGAMSDTFGMVSLMAPWNTAMKQIAGTVSIQRIVRAIRAESAGKLSGSEAEYLRSTGIGKDTSRAILKQLQTHSAVSGKTVLPNITEWGTDQAGRDAADIFSAAVTRDIDRIIVTPGQDKPLAATGKWGEFGRHLFQFRSFAIASTQRTMIAGLQQADRHAFNGLWLSVALGAAATAIKGADAGRDLSNKDTAWWIKEGIDRSGTVGWVFDANNILEKATRGNFGISAFLDQEPLSRYASRNAVGAIFGPTLGAVEDIVKVIGAVSNALGEDEPLIQSDVRAARRLLPYNNMLLFRQAVDKAEKSIAKSLGVKR